MVRAKQASNSSRRNSSFCILLAANHKRHGGRGGERNKLGFRRRGYLRRMGNEIQLERSYASKLAKLNEVSYIPLCVYPPPPPSVFTNYTPVASSLPPSCHPLICDQPLSFFFFLFSFFSRQKRGWNNRVGIRLIKSLSDLLHFFSIQSETNRKAGDSRKLVSAYRRRATKSPSNLHRNAGVNCGMLGQVVPFEGGGQLCRLRRSSPREKLADAQLSSV